VNIIYKILEKLYTTSKDNLVYNDISMNVHNRNYLEKVLKNKYKDAAVNIVVMDINNLKIVNDTDGHIAGDEVVLSACKHFKECFGADNCARFGGDEFIAFTDISKETISNNMMKFTNNNTYAIGVGCKKSEDSIGSIMKIADRDMYQNKRAMKITNENDAYCTKQIIQKNLEKNI